MRMTILVLHICGGILGVLSGFAAVVLRKGARWHALAGNVFVASMLTMSSAGTYLAARKHQMDNVCGGIITFYMVATAWRTAKNREGAGGMVDWGPLAFILLTATGMMVLGFAALASPAGKEGTPPAMYFVFGTIALLAGAGDLRMLVRGGVSGTKRLVRHLWRANFAWFVASGSIFLARPHLFPQFMRTTGMLTGLGFLPLVVMIGWLIRVRVVAYRQRRAVAGGGRLAAMGT